MIRGAALRTGAALAAALLLAARAPLAAQHAWQPDARVTISDFSRIVGIAADAWGASAATPNGLIRYDPAQRRWELPLTEEDGWPVRERPTAFASVDHGMTLLLGTWTGGVWRVDVDARRVEPITSLPGAITAIRGDADGNAWLRTALGWFRLAPGSFIAEPASGAPPAAAAADPYLAAMRGQLELDPELRRWPITTWAQGANQGEYFIGTDGGGMAFVDTRTLRVEWLRFGAPTTGAGTVGSAVGRLWFGADGGARGRATLSSASFDLQQWSVPPERAAPRAAVRAVAEHDGAAWFGAADGLFRHDGRNGWRQLGTREGLPSERITALQPAPGGLWVATERGLCLLRGEACAATLLAGQSVRALALCEGHAWAGTRAGLHEVTETGAAAVSAAGVRRPVHALACGPAGLVVATDAAVLEHDGSSWRELAIPALGRVHALASGQGGLWVGGDAGVAQRDDATGLWAYYIVPSDIPQGPVYAILPHRSGVWLATPGGNLRLELQPQ